MTHVPAVVVTGIGIVSCLGRGTAANREAVTSGRSGIRVIEYLDIHKLDCRIAGEVPSFPRSEQPRNQDRFTALAVMAAEEAIADAGVRDSGIDQNRLATIVGTGLGGCETLDAGYERLYGRGLTRLPPTLIPASMYNAATSAVASHVGARGPAFSIVSACASSAHAIGLAAMDWIRTGRADMVVRGGSDAPLTFGIIRAWESMRVLAIDNEHPETACRALQRGSQGARAGGRSGGVRPGVARTRTFARPEDPRSSCPGSDRAAMPATSPTPRRTAPRARSSRPSIDAGLAPAGHRLHQRAWHRHAGQRPRGDPRHQSSLRRGQRRPVSSTKSLHGHAMGASGAIELALTILALRDGFLPPTINLTEPDPDCDLDYVPIRPRPARVEHFLSNSFGFGGMNAVMPGGLWRKRRKLNPIAFLTVVPRNARHRICSALAGRRTGAPGPDRSVSPRRNSLIVEKKHTDNFTILYVEGLIKLGESAEFFSSALENVLKNESTNVIIDFTKIDYIDSTGIGELVGYLGKFSTQNRKLILVNPSERIQKLLKLAKLDAVFKIYSTEEEAIAAEKG